MITEPGDGSLSVPHIWKSNMLGKIELICVAKLDTFDGRTYEAHVRCLSREDGKALVALMEQRSPINGFEVKGYQWKPVARIEEVPGEDGVQKEYVLSSDIYISFKASDDDDSTNMTNLLWDIDSVIK